MADINAADLISKIQDAKGNVSAVARAFGVSRKTIYNYIERYKTAQDALEDARETMLDNAESILYKKVLEGSTPELLFFLKTQGKRRGYVERSEVTGADGGEIETKTNVSFDYSKLSTEQLKQLVTIAESVRAE